MMSRYTHIFFDLDRTIWDFERNSLDTLLEMHADYLLQDRGSKDAREFVDVYKEINEHYWLKYRDGRIDKATLRVIRFQQTLAEYGIIERELAETMAEDYLKRCPQKCGVIEGAHQILAYLVEKGYELHVMTNGFEDVQAAKLRNSLLHEHFGEVITSDRAGARKPDVAVFEFSLNLVGGEPGNSLMVGDDLEADVIGAHNSGMDQVFFNPHRSQSTFSPTYQIQALNELRSLL